MFLISFCLQEEFYQFSRVCLRPRSFKESLFLESVSDQAMPSHVVSLALLAILPGPSFLSQRFQHLDRHLIKSFQFLLGKFVFVVLELRNLVFRFDSFFSQGSFRCAHHAAG